MEIDFNRIAVKVGSNVLTRRDGTLDVTRMSALVDQIAELHKAGIGNKYLFLPEPLLRDVVKCAPPRSWTA